MCKNMNYAAIGACVSTFLGVQGEMQNTKSVR